MWTARCGRRMLLPSTHQKSLCLSSRHCSTSFQAPHHPRRLHPQHGHQRDACSSRRHFSKYISVDHSMAYDQAMSSAHGMQIQLALEEGRGKDSLPYDPFSQVCFGCRRGDSPIVWSLTASPHWSSILFTAVYGRDRHHRRYL